MPPGDSLNSEASPVAIPPSQLGQSLTRLFRL